MGRGGWRKVGEWIGIEVEKMEGKVVERGRVVEKGKEQRKGRWGEEGGEGGKE